MHQGHILEVIIDRQICFDRPLLESYSASEKEFDIDHRGDHHHSARGAYGDAAVRPVLGTAGRIGSDRHSFSGRVLTSCTHFTLGTVAKEHLQ